MIPSSVKKISAVFMCHDIGSLTEPFNRKKFEFPSFFVKFKETLNFWKTKQKIRSEEAMAALSANKKLL